MEAKEVARRIHEKLMSRHQSGSRALWQGTGDQLAEVLNEVKREAEQPAPHPAEPDHAPATPGPATKVMLEYHRQHLENLQEIDPDLDFRCLGNPYLIAVVAFLDEWGVALKPAAQQCESYLCVETIPLGRRKG